MTTTMSNLSSGQRACVAARRLPLLQAELKQSRTEGGDRRSKQARNKQMTVEGKSVSDNRADKQLARELNVGKTTISLASRLLRERPDLFQLCEEGKLAIFKAEQMRLMDRGQTWPTVKVPDKKAPAPAMAPSRLERLELAQLETMLESKLEAFLDGARILYEIRERRLYQEVTGNFYRYLRDRWGISYSKKAAVTCGVDTMLIREFPGEK